MGGRRDNRQHTHTHVNKTDKTMMMWDFFWRPF
jgi:hypothetical protein